MDPSRSRIAPLREVPLLRMLDEADLAEIAELLIERKFPKGATILEEGVPGDYMYLIEQGQVKVTKISDDGREKVLETLSAGDFVGEMALLDEEPRSASVKTTRTCVLQALSRQDFLRLLKRNPEVSMTLIRVLSHRLREADEQIRALLFDRVESRVRRLLSRLACDSAPDDAARRLTPPLTHQSLAEQAGTSRETITRVIKQLKDEGWLHQVGKRYLVPADAA